MGKIDDISNKYYSDNKSNDSVENVEQQSKDMSQYSIIIDIDGLIMSDLNGDKIIFTERTNYFSENFPVRHLKIGTSAKNAGVIMNKKSDININGYNGLIKIKVQVNPSNSAGYLNKAFNDGEFLGLLLTSDSNYEFTDVINDESSLYKTPKATTMNIELLLFRENELTFSLKNTNRYYSSSNLSDIFITSLVDTNPTLKLIASKFDHDPLFNKFLVNSMSFTDVIDLMEDEVGFYNTDYISFIEYNIFYFLNKKNNINCKNKEMERSLHLIIGRIQEQNQDRVIRKDDDYNTTLTLPQNKVKVYKDTESFLRISKSFILPNGTQINHSNSISRNNTVIRKLTNTQPIRKSNILQYEFIDILIDSGSFNFLNPLSKITYMDSFGVKRVYRLSGKQIEVRAGVYSKLKLTGFRTISE